MTIDNGNHLLLSGNYAALDYLKTIGAQDRLIGPPDAAFPFIDLASGEEWTLRFNKGRLPLWLFDAQKRVPDTRWFEYLPLGRLLVASREDEVGELIRFSGTVYERLVRPLLLAALNIDPAMGSARLAGAIVRETLAAGGRACRPLIARDGLSTVLIEPAFAFLATHGAAVRFGHQLHALRLAGGMVEALDFGKDMITLAPGDEVILAVPPWAAATLVPGLATPNEFRAIVNAHFRVEPAPNQPPILGVLNATTEWIFAFPGRVSVTISAADRLIETPRDALAQTIWTEVAAATRLPPELPRWQIVRERRATFAATPTQEARRPGAETQWRNLTLAGDWTNTGLPATIEGAIRSGQCAAGAIARRDP
jgi:squalene-associated FAD-dependent desaturase